jgi:hypothetical protein
VQIAQESSFLSAFLSTRSNVSRNDGERPRFGESDVSEAGQVASCSEGKKFIRTDNGIFGSAA